MKKESVFATQTEEYKNYQLQLKQATKDMDDAIEAPNKKMKESAFDVFDSILLKGEDFHKVFKQLWEPLHSKESFNTGKGSLRKQSEPGLRFLSHFS